MTTKRVALALAALALPAFAACSRTADHAAPQPATGAAASAGGSPATDGKQSVCDVYGFAVAQVNTAQRGYEAVISTAKAEEAKLQNETEDEKQKRADAATWNLSVMTTQFDDYLRQVAAQIVENPPPVIRQPLADWADEHDAWKKDVPADLRTPLARWVDATLAMKNDYWNRRDEKTVQDAVSDYSKARDDANGKCGV